MGNELLCCSNIYGNRGVVKIESTKFILLGNLVMMPCLFYV